MPSIQLWISVKSKLQRWFCYDIWNVGVVHKDIDEICSDGRLTDVTWVPRQVGYEFIADPFVLMSFSKLTVLLEKFEYKGTCKGKISRCQLALGTGQYELHDVLDRDCHLSHPYVFCDGGSCYCVPEMHESKRCELFIVRETGDLEFTRTMLDGIPVVDATIFFENDRWWLFCTHGGSVELYVYHAETLSGEWTAHALNPVKSDVSSSRPAGPPYRRRGGLYRPAQDCSTTYGGAVAINRILELAPDRFREEVVCRIEPETSGEYPHGFHTLNVLDGTCVVDGKRTVIDWTWFFRGWVFGARSRARLRRLRGAPMSQAARHGGRSALMKAGGPGRERDGVPVERHERSAISEVRLGQGVSPG